MLDAAIADSGALFVAAAGNGGEDLDDPAGDALLPGLIDLPNVLAVAALDQYGRLASFSNYGAATVDLAAPGTNILSTYPADFDCRTRATRGRPGRRWRRPMSVGSRPS